MIYYKQIDIDSFDIIQTKTLEFINSRGQPKIGFSVLPMKEYTEYCPEILTAFSRYNIKPVSCALYTTTEQEQSRVHVDYILDNMPQCRINIPILNCEGSRTEFYTGGEYDVYTQPNGIPYLEIKKDSVATKVDEVEITVPTIIRVQKPHRVNSNLVRVPRICMTVRCDVDPVFLLE